MDGSGPGGQREKDNALEGCPMVVNRGARKRGTAGEKALPQHCCEALNLEC